MKRPGLALPIVQITRSLWRGSAHQAWSPEDRRQALAEFLWCCSKVGDDEIDVVEIGAALGLHLEAREPTNPVGALKTRGGTALHVAIGTAERPSGAALDMLLKAGGLLEVADACGVRPLAWASWTGDSEAVEALLAAGAEMDASGPEGWTPLMHACEGGWEACVGMLLAAGASLDAVNDRGIGARAIAAAQGESMARLVETEAARRDAAALEQAAGPGAGPLGPRRQAL